MRDNLRKKNRNVRKLFAIVCVFILCNAFFSPTYAATTPSIQGDISKPADGLRILGDTMDFTVSFTDPVVIVGTDSTLILDINGVSRNANYQSKTAMSVTYRYTILAGDDDDDGIEITGINLNNSTIRDVDGNNVDLTLTGHLPSMTGLLVDTTAPSVKGIISKPGDASYKVGDILNFIVTFTENVTITGTDSVLALDIGGLIRQASYVTKTANSITYRYTIQNGEVDTNGIEIWAITLNTTMIRDIANNDTDVSLTGHLPATTGVIVDTTVPEVSGNMNVPGDMTYKVGDALNFTVTFDENVNVSSSNSVLEINIGGITKNAVYVSKAANSITYRYMVQAGDFDSDGIAITGINLNGDTIQDVARNDANLNLMGHQPSLTGILVNGVVPTVISVNRNNPAGSSTNANSVVYTITFSEPVSGVDTGDFTLTKTGTADGIISAVSGANETTIDVTVNTILGDGTLRLDLKNSGTGIINNIGNAISDGFENGQSYTIDNTLPFILSTTPADNVNDVEITSNLSIHFNEAVAKGTGFISIIDASGNLIEAIDVTSGEVTGNNTNTIIINPVAVLLSNTSYYVQIDATAFCDGVGNSYQGISDATSWNFTTYSPSTSTQTTESKQGAFSEPFVVTVNGIEQAVASTETKTVNNQTVTTVTIDDEKIKQKLEAEAKGTTLVISVNNKSDVVVGQLNGQTIKNMQEKEAILEVKTENATYILPASEINMDDVFSQIGEQTELKDIKVSVTISDPQEDTVKLVQDTASKNSYQVVVKPVEFNITCTIGDKTFDITKFNGYVERKLAIPEGIDPSKITTGIVLNKDGSFSHVPTTIIVIDGKYYAKINSLTNSTYCVVWNPKTYLDIQKHWAEKSIENMLSRLVMEGFDERIFKPDEAITRGEFVASIIKGLGLARLGNGKATFTDVNETNRYYDLLKTAFDYKIVLGYGDGTFKPETQITREEAMLILLRAMKIAKINTEITDAEVKEILSKYLDGKAIGIASQNAIAICIREGVLVGNKNVLSIEQTMTRAQTAAVIERVLKKAKLI